MIDVLFRLLLIGVLVTGTYVLFGLFNEAGTITFSSPTVEGELHAVYPELIFLLGSWLMFLLLPHLRLTVLTGFIGSQILLVQPLSTVYFRGYGYPIYVLVAVNCFYLLILYFYFTSDRWVSGSLEDASEKYKRNNS